jgi:hypothetical protein
MFALELTMLLWQRMPPPQGVQQDNDFEYNLVAYLNRINEEVNVQETNHKQKKNSLHVNRRIYCCFRFQCHYKRIRSNMSGEIIWKRNVEVSTRTV